MPTEQAQDGIAPPQLVLQLVQSCKRQGLDDVGAATMTIAFLMEAIGFAIHLGSISAEGVTDEAKRVTLARDLAESLLQIPQHPGLAAIAEAKRTADKAGPA